MLDGHQQAVRSLLDEAEQVLSSIEPSRTKALSLLRWQLMRVLRSYQLFKHVELFDPLARSLDAERARRACSMKARCIAINDAYGTYVERWSTSSIDARWPDYKRDAHDMMHRLRSHLEREAYETGLLLRGVECTRRA